MGGAVNALSPPKRLPLCADPASGLDCEAESEADEDDAGERVEPAPDPRRSHPCGDGSRRGDEPGEVQRGEQDVDAEDHSQYWVLDLEAMLAEVPDHAC